MLVCQNDSMQNTPCRQTREGGFTLLELILGLVIAGLLSAIAVPLYGAIVDRARTGQAIADLGWLDMEIERYVSNNFSYPDSLAQLPGTVPLDPWGRPYQYLRIRGNEQKGLRGRLRKDKNLVPINSDYDLYSRGEDGDTRPPLTVPVSHDDVIRAADGSFMGIAESF